MNVSPVPVPNELDRNLDTLVTAIIAAIDDVQLTPPLTSSLVCAALGRIIERTGYVVAQETYAKTTEDGLWATDDLRRAFVAGAAWWEYQTSHATMWQSDRDEAEAEAERQYPKGKPRLMAATPVGDTP